MSDIFFIFSFFILMFFFISSHRWWQMPEICIMPSIPLLASFQQLTELSESAHILQDLSRQQNRGPIENQYSHLKDILETWRLRTPNEWERVSTWSDIMLWRNVIYNIVINAFQSVKDVAPHLHQLGYRDRAWSVNRSGTNFCTHRQRSLALRAKLLNAQHQSSMTRQLTLAFDA